MPILNAFQHIDTGGIKAGIKYPATVIANNDPDMNGRIMFKIPNIMDYGPVDSPWAIPKNNSASGAHADSEKNWGSIDVPEVGSSIIVEFQQGSPYHPEYSSMYISNNLRLEDAKTNYPHRKVHKYPNGMKVIVDTKKNELIIENPGSKENPGSTNISLYGPSWVTVKQGDLSLAVEKGNATVYSHAETNINAGGSINLTTKKGAVIKAEGSITLSGAGKIFLAGDGKGLDYSGLLTANCICPATGGPHPGASTNVFATAGGTVVPGISPT